MLPQLTVYAKIIYLLMVVISGALCTVEDYVIMSQCAHNKAIHLAAAGTVSVTDISQIQNITIVGLPDYVNNEFKIALYAKETQRYLCFNDNWRLVGMRELRDTCYFNETIVHGYFVFRSVVDLQRRVGFTHRGKPVGPKKSVNDACYMFNKIDAEQFFHQHTLPKWHEMAASQMIASNGNGNGSGNGSGSGSGSMENSRQWLQEGDNKLHKQLLPLQPPTGSTRVPSATTSRRRPGSSAAATATATATSTVESMATTPQQHGLIDKIFSVYKNIKSNLNNTLTEASPTVDTRSTVTAATTTKKSLRKSTQKLMATPYHQLTYVRNEAGDIDIDNLDNISVYPDLFEGELDVSDSGNGNGSTNSNSRLTFVSGYLATSPTSVLPESIRIAKIKINNERRRLQLHSSQRRFA
ncbi:merozoite surface antigen 2 isoform X4 [Drosophila guanche]|uniref:merozoite surface antigen 2 isoform X4 n=1 Tax=Drosophila guanche TaxID=7266 RepID=UPI00147147A5|nr:merozoite surface antigen 2 isoform X4 [Drosophila guanche]